jgi:glycosyltransferase involved in cell wall biosynthesis
MKIGIFSDVLEYRWTGIGTYTYHLIKNLSRMSLVDVSLINSVRDPDSPLEQIIIPNPFPALKTVLWYPYVVNRIKKYDVDIVHNPSQVATYFKFRQKNVVTIHDLTPKICSSSHALTTILDFNLLMPRTLDLAERIIADSESTKKDLVRYLKISPEKIKVIHIAADEAYRLLPENDPGLILWKMKLPDRFILSVGTLEPRKNITTLIIAFHMLRKEGLKHKLVIIGKKGWKYQQIFRLVDELHLNRDVIFIDHAPINDLCAIYNLAEVFVYPSLYEGFGLPPLEAMSCGCPVITSNISSLPDVVGNAGIMVDPYDTKGLSQNIKMVINDSDLKKRMIMSGIKRAESFQWEQCIRETTSVYESCING